MISKFQEYPGLFSIEPFRTDVGALEAYYHIHDKYELSFCLGGQLYVYNNDLEMHIAAPCLILHRPYTVHFVDVESNAPYIRRNIYFDSVFLDGIDRRIVNVDEIFSENLCVYSLNDLQIGRLCQLTSQLYDDSNSHIRQLLLAALLKDIGQFSSGGERIANNRRSLYICDVISYICRHYMDELDTARLAKQFFVSQTKLNRDFRFYTQTTVRQFITRVRMRGALRLIMSGSTVADAAHKCGISDSSHFIRTFKSCYGTTPYQYVKQGIYADHISFET